MSANAQTISKLDARRISSPIGGPSVSPPQMASPYQPMIRPRRSGGARSTIQAEPAV